MTMSDELRLASAPRWRGQPGRIEVWYATLTDPLTGAALWVHYETVAPAPDTGAKPYAHGWATWFPAGGPPCTGRFGPEPLAPRPLRQDADVWFAAAVAQAAFQTLTGCAGGLGWDLRWTDASAPLWTFPRSAWERELLPGAQVVLAPSASFSGTVTVGATAHSVDGWRGAVAHIYGHGNARRWGWIHADLGGSDVLEVVTAVSHKPGLRSLAPLAFVRFRLDGRDWPSAPLPSLRMRTTLHPRHWRVQGHIGRQAVAIRVDQAPQRCVSLRYTDPDGAPAVCTNSEQADIHIELGDRDWQLRGTGHAEVGLRGGVAPRVDEGCLP